MKRTWRERAAAVIDGVLREQAGQDERAVRRALRDAYPWGQRRYHPYRVWCDECNRRLALAFRPARPERCDLSGLPLFEGREQQ